MIKNALKPAFLIIDYLFALRQKPFAKMH